MSRIDGRKPDQLRPVKIHNNYIKHADGSVLIEVGNTKVICTATIDEKVPPFLKGEGKGWITAEYGMLPRATSVRNIREAAKGKLSGRTQEIQRLIGRALRAVVDLKTIGERTIVLDCDVIQADGGTRTASITGAFVAMVESFKKLLHDGLIEKMPVSHFVAATSVGVVNNQILLDLCFEEDSAADVDFNLVMTENYGLIEVQGSGEEAVFTREQLNLILDTATLGIKELIKYQENILGDLTRSEFSNEVSIGY